MTTQPTQVRQPTRTTIRTVFQAAVSLASLAPLIAAGIYNGEGDYPVVVVQVLAVSAAVTRVMAIPAVEQFLKDHLPFLAAQPRPSD